MLKIGLTGGIGSGKSTVAKYFAELGIDIIDADVIAREVVAPGTKAHKKILAKFGTVDRDALRKLIFQNPADKKWLEELLHPIIIKEMQHQVTQATSPYCILVIPLLFETKLQHLVDRILVVDASEEQQINRTMARGLTEHEVKAIIKTQIDREQRLSMADDTIHNNKTLVELKQQVKKLHKQYLDI